MLIEVELIPEAIRESLSSAPEAQNGTVGFILVPDERYFLRPNRYYDFDRSWFADWNDEEHRGSPRTFTILKTIEAIAESHPGLKVIFWIHPDSNWSHAAELCSIVARHEEARRQQRERIRRLSSPM